MFCVPNWIAGLFKLEYLPKVSSVLSPKLAHLFDKTAVYKVDSVSSLNSGEKLLLFPFDYFRFFLEGNK